MGTVIFGVGKAERYLLDEMNVDIAVQSIGNFFSGN